MVDRAELRRLAEAVQQGDNPAALSSRMAFVTAASPDVVLGLLHEIDQLSAEVERQKAWAQQMAMADAVHYRDLAVRLKRALQELESRVFEDGAPDDVLEEVQGILADPEVEKL